MLKEKRAISTFKKSQIEKGNQSISNIAQNGYSESEIKKTVTINFLLIIFFTWKNTTEEFHINTPLEEKQVYLNTPTKREQHKAIQVGSMLNI